MYGKSPGKIACKLFVPKVYHSVKDQAGLLASVLLPTFPSFVAEDSGLELATGIPTPGSGLSLQLREQLRSFTGFPFNTRNPLGPDNLYPG